MTDLPPGTYKISFTLQSFGTVLSEGIELSGVFFFQAEDGIRDLTVTGVQTCALPISRARSDRPASSRVVRARPRRVRRKRESGPAAARREPSARAPRSDPSPCHARRQIGRASCRERV